METGHGTEKVCVITARLSCTVYILTLYDVYKGFGNYLDGENKVNTKTFSPFWDRNTVFEFFQVVCIGPLPF